MELEQKLEELKNGIESKTKTQIENELKAIKEAFDASSKVEIKAIKDELLAEIKSIQDHADKLDVKLQAKSVANAPAENLLTKTIKENIEEIKTVSKGKSVQVKAVANMTTANLTGTAPRTFNFDIVTIPSQKVNVEDLVGVVNADNGIYTYTVEGAGEGSIGAQTEGAAKNQRDYDFTNTDVATNFIAGFARYSKKMRNNLSYIANTIPRLLQRDYYKAENSAFNTVLAGAATASTEIITSSSKSKMLINEIGKLENADYDINGIVVRPSDYLDILKTAKQDLESAVTYENGILRVAGVQVLKATWLAANKYYVGDWSRVNKVVTEGISLEFSDSEGSNFVNNNITARIESQVALAVEQPLAVVYGDFTAV
jgi:HK97 family phage major capsid protein